MKYECDRIADEIWDHVGEDLPTDIREHIAACPDCGRAADEARRLLPMVQAVGCVPDAPDCRSAVMERISSRSAFRPVWAYALASVLLIAVVVTGLLSMRSGPRQTVPQMADQPRQEIVKPQTPIVEKPHIPAPVIEKRKTVVRHPEVKRPRRMLPKRTPTEIVKRAPKQETAPEQTPAPALEVVSYEDEPVAAVAVTWPSADPQPDGWSGYTNINTVTGEVTVCRTERSGDSVSIYLESRLPGEKPGKGA